MNEAEQTRTDMLVTRETTARESRVYRARMWLRNMARTANEKRSQESTSEGLRAA